MKLTIEVIDGKTTVTTNREGASESNTDFQPKKRPKQGAMVCLFLMACVLNRPPKAP